MAEASAPSPSAVPVALVDDGTVLYFSADTVVTWPSTHDGSPYLLGSFRRGLTTGYDSSVRLPDGRLAWVEGWQDEALRLRADLGRHAPPAPALAPVEALRASLGCGAYLKIHEGRPGARPWVIQWTALDAPAATLERVEGESLEEAVAAALTQLDRTRAAVALLQEIVGALRARGMPEADLTPMTVVPPASVEEVRVLVSRLPASVQQKLALDLRERLGILEGAS